MIDNRAAILNGVKGAHELHRDLGIREQVERSEGWRIDVFNVISPAWSDADVSAARQAARCLPSWR